MRNPQVLSSNRARTDFTDKTVVVDTFQSFRERGLDAHTATFETRGPGETDILVTFTGRGDLTFTVVDELLVRNVNYNETKYILSQSKQVRNKK